MGNFPNDLLARFAGYWASPVSDRIAVIRSDIGKSGSRTKRLAVSGLLSAAAALMQSAGALGGPGLAISALATLPVAVACVMAIQSGVMAYISTILLLLLLQPSEVILFPFTTGLIGIGLGFAFRIHRKRAAVIAFASLVLTAGIVVLLYLFRFPVLGPLAGNTFHPATIALIYVLSFFYCTMWVEITGAVMKFLARIG